MFKQKTAYEMRISDWSSDVCSTDLDVHQVGRRLAGSVLADEHVGHRFTINDGLIQAMEVCPRPSSGPGVSNSFKPDPLHRFNAAATDQPANRFECDGRNHCSQMRSCAEAGCFLRTAHTPRWMENKTATLVRDRGAINR